MKNEDILAYEFEEQKKEAEFRYKENLKMKTKLENNIRLQKDEQYKKT